MKYMLIASNDADSRQVLKDCFKGGYTLDVANNGTECLQMFQQKRYELVFIDTTFLSELGAAEDVYHYHNTLKLFWNIFPSVQLIVLSTQNTIRKAVEAVQAGASNYLTYPIDKKEARYVIQSTADAVRMQSELNYLRDQFWQVESLDVIRTENELMKETYKKVKTVASADTTVLITGETGTGKGVIANLIHRHSARKDKQFISVHCGAIPENLIESELFGHEKGSFTGAIKRKLGKFEIAQGGTIFLDEIGTMPLPAQITLLQVLQDRTFHRVGGEDILTCDIRIIAASNINLEEMSENGTFRKDLFYRLNVFPIDLPPLRSRKEDILILSDYFLQKLNKKNLKKISRIHPDVIYAFMNYPWPGNIRELENLIERAYLLESSRTLLPKSFPRELFHDINPLSTIPIGKSMTLSETRKMGIEEIERNYLIKLLGKNKGKIKQTAKDAAISTRQLHKLMLKHGIKKEDFKINIHSI